MTSIRNNTAFNELENTAVSTMVGIMGRISAYTGKETTWDEMMNSDLKIGPTVFVFGPVDIPKEVPIAGEAYVPPTPEQLAEQAKRRAERQAQRAASQD